MFRISRYLLAAAVVMVLAHANAAAAAPQTGRQVVVSVSRAPLMRGSQTLATVAYGQRLNVIEMQGQWVGTSVIRNGRRIAGWIWNGQTSLPDQFAARQAVRRYSYQPIPGAGGYMGGAYPNPYATNVLPPNMGDYNVGGVRSSSPLMMGETPYGRSYWRADRKVIGY